MLKLRLLTAALVLSMSGCAALSDLLSRAFITPKLHFQRVTLGDLNLESATLNLEYAVENPNPIGIDLAEIQYALFVEGKQVVAGSPPRGLRIAANGQSTVVFPANLKFADLAPTLMTFLEKDFAHYKAQGSLGLDTPVGIVRLPLEKEGDFEVPKVPQVELAAPRIQNLGFTSATVELPFTITNRNSYPLPLGGLVGGISIAGAQVGSVNTGDLGLLTPKAAKSISLPVTIQFLQAASAAYALRNGSGTVAFNGELVSGPARIPLEFSQDLQFTR